jgi:hypothetical protein
LRQKLGRYAGNKKNQLFDLSIMSGFFYRIRLFAKFTLYKTQQLGILLTLAGNCVAGAGLFDFGNTTSP